MELSLDEFLFWWKKLVKILEKESFVLREQIESNRQGYYA